MTTAQFIEKIEKILQDSGEFEVYTKENDSNFAHLEDDEIAVVGEDETQTFAIKIIKVD